MIVGLTGSIGMGKTTTASMFRDAGVSVHDSDSAVHELYASEAAGLIEAAFPGVSSNGVVDRAILAKRVLGDSTALKQLEQIVHPLVSQHRESFLQRAQARGFSLCIVDIPLLFESGADQSVDIVLVVTASSAVQKQRVMARPGMTEQKFQAILSRQIPDSEKRRKAHWIIDTSFGLAHALRQTSGFLRSVYR